MKACFLGLCASPIVLVGCKSFQSLSDLWRLHQSSRSSIGLVDMPNLRGFHFPQPSHFTALHFVIEYKESGPYLHPNDGMTIQCATRRILKYVLYTQVRESSELCTCNGVQVYVLSNMCL